MIVSRDDPVFELTLQPASSSTRVRIAGQIDAQPSTRVVDDPTDVLDGDVPRIVSLSYEDSEKAIDKLTFVVDNYDMTWYDSALFRAGTIVVATWGYAGRRAPHRTAIIQKIKGARQLSVEAHGQAALLHRQQRTRVFTNVMRHQVVEQIADEYGFGPGYRFVDPDPSGTVWENIPQARMTDAGLCARLAKKIGFEFYIDIDGLHFHPRRTGGPVHKIYTYFTDPTRGEVRNISVENDLFTRKTGGITAKGKDAKTGAAIVADGSNATATATPALAQSRDTFTGISARDGTELTTQERSTVASTTVAPTTAPTAAVAAQEAAAVYTKNQFTVTKLKLDVLGDPGVLAKSVIELRGAGRISGKYWAKTVKHALMPGSGYTMTIELGRDGGSGATSGKKTGTVVPPKAAQNAAEPLPPTSPNSMFYTGDSLEQVSARDGTSTFVDSGGRSAQTTSAATDDPLAFYRD